MVGFPNAKINLGLNILGKRRDGYHDISTCFYPVKWCDILEIVPKTSGKTDLTVTGLAIPGKKEDNLCLKAYRLLKKDFDIPGIDIHLHKSIPPGSGLGGGSSDAAEILKLSNRLFNLFLDDEILAWYALKLGSDCPFFIYNKPLLAFGRGEILEEVNVNLSGRFIILVSPGFPVSTAEAYRNVNPAIPGVPISEIIENNGPEKWKGLLENDFENHVLRLYPELARLKEQFYDTGALYSSLTGSGSGIYGLFHHRPEIFPEFPPGFIVWSGEL